jgi:hypothetical protein
MSDIFLKPFGNERIEIIFYGLILDSAKYFAGKGIQQQSPGTVFGNAPGLKIEKSLLVQLSRGAAVRALHIVSPDFQLRFCVDRRRVAE